MEQFYPILLTSLVIGIFGEVARKLVRAKAGDKGFKGVYFVTFKAHGVFVGAAIGLLGFPVGIPVPVVFGAGLGGAVLAYAGSGALAMVAYSTMVGTLKNLIRHKGAR